MKKRYPIILFCATIFGITIRSQMMQPIINAPGAPRMSMTNIGLSAEQRKSVASLLNQLLADEYLLYTKTLNYHWNVKGKFFGPLHDFFGKQYEELQQIVDDIAERVQSIGFPATGTMQEFLQLTRLKEISGTLNEQEMLQNLLNDYEAIIKTLRVDLQRCADEFNDMGTSDFLTDLLKKHEKTAWMIRSHLE